VFRLGKGFRCFSWLSVVYFIAGAIDIALPVTVKLRLQQMAMAENPLPVIDAAMKLLDRFLIAGGVILAVCIVFAIVAAIGNKLIKRK
jgi:hypothetical protein